jgi:hypothetical protein
LRVYFPSVFDVQTPCGCFTKSNSTRDWELFKQFAGERNTLPVLEFVVVKDSIPPPTQREYETMEVAIGI